MTGEEKEINTKDKHIVPGGESMVRGWTPSQACLAKWESAANQDGS